MIEKVSKKSCESGNPKNPGSDLPPNWSWVKLGDVCEKIIGGGTPSTKNSAFWLGDIPWITSADIKGLRNIVPRKNINKNAIKESATNLLPKGNLIVVTRVGLGKLAKNEFDLCFSQDSQGLIINKKIIDVDFALMILSVLVQSFIVNNRGTTISGVTKKQLSELTIPLPPLPEQKKIVEKIEELFSRLDSGVASLKKAKEQIRLYRQSVLSVAFSGRLSQGAGRQAHSVMLKAAEPKVDYTNQLPEGWKWVKLGEVVKIVSGNTPKGLESISNTGSLQFYKVSDMNSVGNERKMLKSNLYLTTEEMKKLKIKIYPKHTTIFPKRGGAILTNKKRLLATDSSFDLNLMGLIPSATVNYQFLHYWVIKLDLSTIYDGSNVPQINNKNVEPLDFPLPPLNRQTQIVEEIEKRFSEVDNLEKTIDESLVKSETLRQSILKQAFEGKLI